MVRPTSHGFGRDQLAISYLSGKIEDDAGRHLSYFTKKTVTNQIISIAKIVFNVRHDSSPLFNAQIGINNQLLHTGIQGTATIEDLPLWITYPYTISLEGYEAIADSVFLKTDTTLHINLTPPRTLPAKRTGLSFTQIHSRNQSQLILPNLLKKSG